MANIARTQMLSRPISHVGVMDWLTAPLVALLAMSWPKRLACIGGTAVALMGVVSLAAHAVNGWSFHLWGSGRLPASAAERAPLFTAAWAAHDEKAMKQFVLAADQSKLSGWAAANPVPTPVTSIPPSDRTIKTVSVQKDDLDGAILKVRISDESVAGSDTKEGAFTQHQLWTYSGGNWYFSPEAPPAIAEQRVAISPPPRTAIPPAPSRPAPPNADETETPTRAPASRNVIIPTTVPPWQRVR
jgi:hypothetical protein